MRRTWPLLALLLLLMLLAGTKHLRLNLSPSLPLGLYVLSERAPRRGDIVVVRLPPSVASELAARGYIAHERQPLAKVLLAGPSDQLDFGPSGVSLAGVLAPASSPRPYDSEGRELRHAAFGRRRLDRGEFWVYSSHPRSYDSRYLGPIEADPIPLVPLLTFEP